MSWRSEAYLQGIPTKPYDLLREGLILLLLWTIVIVGLAALFGSPDYPVVRGEDVAQRQPLAFLQTSATILAGNSSLQGYNRSSTTWAFPWPLISDIFTATSVRNKSSFFEICTVRG